MGVNYHQANNGRQAWEGLLKIAEQADAAHLPVSHFIQLILTDVEMPEMDGYILTKNIKSDPRFAGIPVIMHSSLSGMSNQQLGRSVGVDEYVSKFEPVRLSETVARILQQSVKAAA
jgi:two-component system chemotaxis response regulator CheV